MTAPQQAEWAEDIADADSLGPALLPNTPDATGLEELQAEAPQPRRRRRAETEAPETPPITGDMLRNALRQIDKTVSLVLRIEEADPEFMDGVADQCAPLANHFAAKSESVVAMAIVAGLGILSYAVVKYQALQNREAQHGSQERQS